MTLPSTFASRSNVEPASTVRSPNPIFDVNALAGSANASTSPRAPSVGAASM
jgi:hypothetical protein